MKARRKRTREEVLGLEPVKPEDRPFGLRSRADYPMPKKVGWLLVAFGMMVLGGVALKLTGGGATEWSILIIMMVTLIPLFFFGIKIIIAPNTNTARAELEAAELEQESDNKDLLLHGETD